MLGELEADVFAVEPLAVVEVELADEIDESFEASEEEDKSVVAVVGFEVDGVLLADWLSCCLTISI